MRYRLEKLQENSDVPFTRANYYYGNIADHVGYVSVSARSDGDRWKESLVQLNMIIRQGIEQGVSSPEVTRAKKEIMADLDGSVLEEKTEDSSQIAQKIIRSINANRVYQSAEQELKVYAPLVEKITLEDINRQLGELWSPGNRLVSVTGDVKIGEAAEQEIADVFQSSMKQDVISRSETGETKFPYLAAPTKISNYTIKRLNQELNLERVVFGNCLTLNFKKTLFDENRLQVSVNFGQGKLQEPSPGMAMVAEKVINGSGTGAWNKSALDAALAGTSIDLRFRIGESSFIWTGTSLKKDSKKLFQALYSVIIDPGFRKNVFSSTVSGIKQMYKMISRDVEGMVPLKIQPFLASGNPNFGLPPEDSITSIRYEQLFTWAKTIVPDSGMEISLVGDFDRKEVVADIQEYFSGIKLVKNQKRKPQCVVFPNGKTISVEVQTSIPKSLVFVAWPTEDFKNIYRTRKFHLLAAVLEDRLRKVIREKLGATYSPEVYSSNSKVYDGYGFLAAKLIVKPGQEQKIIDEILHLSEQLRSEGVTDEELARAREPVLTSINDTLKNNRYWLYTVLSLSSRYPDQLRWPESILHDYSTISREEIDQLAKVYLVNENSAVAQVSPEKR
jgi:zinc protease